MSRDVSICEMSPRDGLQVVNRAAKLPLSERVVLIETLQEAGLPYIEAGAFVSVNRVPAMADTADLLARCHPYEGQLAALVPSEKHYRRFAEATNVDTVALFVSASEAYSLKNTRMTVDEALDAALGVARLAIRDGYQVRAHVSAAFRDPAGENMLTSHAAVERVCARLRSVQAGMVIALADTDGSAAPEDVENVLGRLQQAGDLAGIGVHLHDRGGRAIEKARAAWHCGVRVFDTSVGGIGGNPTALDNAAGNLATEELVAMFEAMGVHTGIDWERLIDAGAIVTRMAGATGDPPPPSRSLRDALVKRGTPGSPPRA